MPARYDDAEPSRAEVDAHPGVLLLEFGAPWCQHCIAGQPLIDAAVGNRGWQRLCIEDGPGRPLGRSFRVKLWPTLIVLEDGIERARVVRPVRPEDVSGALTLIGNN